MDRLKRTPGGGSGVVFVDGGIDVAAGLAERMPRVILGTAYDQQAVDAFEWNAGLLQKIEYHRCKRFIHFEQINLAKGKPRPTQGSPSRFRGRGQHEAGIVSRAGCRQDLSLRLPSKAVRNGAVTYQNQPCTVRDPG